MGRLIILFIFVLFFSDGFCQSKEYSTNPKSIEPVPEPKSMEWENEKEMVLEKDKEETWQPPPVTDEIIKIPLERPHQLTKIKNFEPQILIDTIQYILDCQGFKVEQKNLDDDCFEILTKKNTSQLSNEKILVWLEKSFDDKQLSIKVFFEYGLYKKIFGLGDGFSRVKVTTENESETIKLIKIKIQSLKIK